MEAEQPRHMFISKGLRSHRPRSRDGCGFYAASSVGFSLDLRPGRDPFLDLEDVIIVVLAIRVDILPPRNILLDGGCRGLDVFREIFQFLAQIFLIQQGVWIRARNG